MSGTATEPNEVSSLSITDGPASPPGYAEGPARADRWVRPGRQRVAGVCFVAALIFTLQVATSTPSAAWSLDWVTGPEVDASAGYITPGVIRSAGTGEIGTGGTFNGVVTFGKGEPNEAVLSNFGYGGPFLAVYNHKGRLAWAKAGDTLGGWIDGVDVDSEGNVVAIGGYFFGSLCFDSICIGNGSDDGEFYVKFDRNGRLQWLREADVGADNIAAAVHGRSIVVGRYLGSSLDGGGLYIAQHRPNGAVRWVSYARGEFGSSSGETWIATDSLGNATVVGTFRGKATFAPGKPNKVVLESAGATDMFIAKYNSDGRLLWVRRWGDGGKDSARELAIDQAGRIFVVGYADDGDQVVLIRYSSNGHLQFAKTLSGIAKVSAVAADEQIHLTGSFTGRAIFGAGEANTVTLQATGPSDAFLAHYGSDGRFLVVEAIRNRESGSGTGVAVDATGHVAVTGSAGPPIRLGNGDDARAWRLGSMFVARYGAKDLRGEAPEDSLNDRTGP